MYIFQQNKFAVIKITIVFLFFILSINLSGGCKNNISANNDGENPDSIDAKFVWRICNESDEYAMENIWGYGFTTLNGKDSLSIGTLEPGNCSNYYPGLHDGNVPPDWVYYNQNGKNYRFIYLTRRQATIGQVDSTDIIDAPGRYTFHFIFTPDTTRPSDLWAAVIIERETHYKNHKETKL